MGRCRGGGGGVRRVGGRLRVARARATPSAAATRRAAPSGGGRRRRAAASDASHRLRRPRLRAIDEAELVGEAQFRASHAATATDQRGYGVVCCGASATGRRRRAPTRAAATACASDSGAAASTCPRPRCDHRLLVVSTKGGVLETMPVPESWPAPASRRAEVDPEVGAARRAGLHLCADELRSEENNPPRHQRQACALRRSVHSMLACHKIAADTDDREPRREPVAFGKPRPHYSPSASRPTHVRRCGDFRARPRRRSMMTSRTPKPPLSSARRRRRQRVAARVRRAARAAAADGARVDDRRRG